MQSRPFLNHGLRTIRDGVPSSGSPRLSSELRGPRW